MVVGITAAMAPTVTVMAVLHNMANRWLLLEDPMSVDSRASSLSSLCLLFNSLKTHVF